MGGALLVEAVTSMIILVLVICAGVVMVAVTGTYMIYKVRLGFIANQAAQYAAGQLSYNCNFNPQDPSSPKFKTPDQKTLIAVNQMCAAMNLPTPATVVISDSGATVVCDVSVTGLGQIYGLPVPVTMSDTGSADLTAYQPPAILEIHPQNPTAAKFKYALPAYGYKSALNFNNTPQYKFYFKFPGPAYFN